MTKPTDDQAIGAFTEFGPWVVDPETMPWRQGIDELRREAASQVPGMVRRRRVPPARAVVIGRRLAGAVLPWYIRNRRDQNSTAAQQRLAAVLHPTFVRLGCTFIKLGQLISSAEGMLPSSLVEEFKSCRDRMPAESFDHVRAVIEEDFGRPVEAVFAWVDPVPIAAASIAQVHAARLIDGTRVVVKVQRPGIGAVVARDIATMAWLAPKIERRAQAASIANLPAYVEMFADTIVEELDFRLEAENMLDIARVLATLNHRPIVIPRPHPELVTRHVLVMERIEGLPVDDEDSFLLAGIEAATVFRVLMVGFLEGAMIHGIFHGDLHAGNMVIDAAGRPALLDFGITGRFTQAKRQALLGLMFSSVAQDGRALLRYFRDLGGFPAEVDIDRLADEIHIDELMFQAPSNPDPEQLALQMRATMSRLVASGAKLPKELFLYMKGLVYLSGAVARMAADVDLVAEVVHVYELFASRHEEHLSAIDLRAEDLPPTSEIADRMRKQLGVNTEKITFREMQQAQLAQSQRLRDAHKHP